MPSRRDVLRTMGAAALTLPGAGAAALAGLEGGARAAPGRSFGIAYTSFAVRLLRGRDVKTGGGLPAESFIDLCHSFGAHGCQIAHTQLASTEAGYLRNLRSSLEAKGLFAELSIAGESLEDKEAFGRMAAAAKQLGVSRLRVALLSGRRYENFESMAQWKEFTDRWRRALPRAAPLIEAQGLVVGIENHKDWLAEDLAEILHGIGSPSLGACVDFGNNIAFLEDPLDVARTLAPFVVTTHLKDMAVRRYEQGFELSEVPLGQGCLPLAEMVAVLRKSRPDVHFCLEMMTRDPLKVPYLEDRYWVTREKRDPARIRRFEDAVLSRSTTAPLPRISDLGDEAKIAAEDSNVRLCAAYATKNLGL
jgi:3-oxoisoapionate decarboxylase